VQSFETIKAGAVAVGKRKGESFELTPADIVIMNPPFTSS